MVQNNVLLMITISLKNWAISFTQISYFLLNLFKGELSVIFFKWAPQKFVLTKTLFCKNMSLSLPALSHNSTKI